MIAALVTFGCSTGDDEVVGTPSFDSGIDARDASDTFVEDSTTDTRIDVEDAIAPDASDAEPETDVMIPEACGNHTVDPGEDCDDGNAIAGDGCSPTCKSESKIPGDTCPGIAIPLMGSTARAGHVDGTTVGALDNYTTSCSLLKGGPDVVHVLTSPIDGQAKITITGDGNTLVSLRTDCMSSASETKCIGAPPGGTTITAAVSAGKPCT